MKMLLPIEVTDFIFDFITYPKTYKSILQLSKYANKTHKYKKYKYCNVLWTLIKKYPNENWSWARICRNPNTTISIFEEQIRLDTSKFTYAFYSPNPNLTIEFVKKHLDKNWVWTFVSSNEGISTQDIENNPDLPWDWEGVSYNPNLTVDFVMKNTHKGLTMNLFSRQATMQYIEDNAQLNWDYNIVTINPNLTIKFVKRHLTDFNENTADYSEISYHPNITLQHISDNPDIPWDFYSICYNPNLIMEMLYDSNIKKFILEGLRKERRSWNGLSYNPNLTMKYVKEHPKIKWDWEGVFENITVTEEFFNEIYKTNFDIINFAGLSMNKYDK